MKISYTFTVLLVATASAAKFETMDSSFGGLGGLGSDGLMSNDFSTGSTDFSLDDAINFGITSDDDSTAEINRVVGLINPDVDFWGAYEERRLAIQDQQRSVQNHNGDPDHIINEIDVNPNGEADVDIFGHPEVTHPIGTQIDILESTKLIGRVGWSNRFEPWIQDQFHTDCIDHNEHPCCFQYICAQPFEDIGDFRRALHLSHNCHKELVNFIIFKTWLPLDDNADDYVQHLDSNGSCEEKNGLFECGTQLTDPKTEETRETGKDDAWLLPNDYNDGDYPWSYAYNIYLTNPGQNYNHQPDDSQPVTDEVFNLPDFGIDGGLAAGNDESLPMPNDNCDLDVIRQKVIPPGFYDVLDSSISMADLDRDFGFGCIKFDDSFMSAGGPIVLERLSAYSAEYHYYGFEWTVSNGRDTRTYQMQPFDANTEPPADKPDDFHEDIAWFSVLSDLAVHYQVNSADWWVVAVTSYNESQAKVKYIGNYNDYSNVMWEEETTLQRSVCGWYYAYDKRTNYNAGFAPIICEEE